MGIFIFFFFFVISSSASFNNTTHKCSAEQRDALLQFKQNLSSFTFNDSSYGSHCLNRIGSDYYPIMMNWNMSIDCCRWDGITCNSSSGDVIGLDLSCGMLRGIIHPNTTLFHLHHLHRLDLAYNHFGSSRFPYEMARFANGLTYLDISHCGFVHDGPAPLSFIQSTNLTVLNLSYNNFSGVWDLGTLLSSLPNLQLLDLSNSGLSVVTNNATNYVNPDFHWLGLASCNLTAFPESLRAMKNLLYLNLSNNDIEGFIPDWAAEIGANGLYYLDLSHNSITGLPGFRWDGLRYMYLQSNKIQGPFPPSICNMDILRYLDMSNNSFSGVIPQCFGNISSSLSVIDLRDNKFHGSIPNVNENCQLVWLILKGNQLEGEVPTSLRNCQDLEILDLGNNQLNGTFPRWLEDFPELQILILKSNNFHGPINTSTTSKWSFRSLQLLDLSHNGFEGHLPRKYFQNFIAMKNVERKGQEPEYLSSRGKFYSIIVVVKGHELLFLKVLVEYTIVDLSNNKFGGEIPDVVGDLNSLKVLNLSHNTLSGQIPHALGNLMEMESLDLSWNQLTGEIPRSLAGITALEVLNLSQNHLAGRIPEGRQFNTFEGSSFGGNLGLCGFPLPNHSCKHPSSPQLEADGDEESGFTWKVPVMLGYICGTPLGLLMGYLMLSIGKPKWFNAIADAGERMLTTRSRRNKRRYIYIGK